MTDPKAPAILIKSVNVLTTMQSKVVIMMIRARKVNLLTTAKLLESLSFRVNLSIIEKAANI